MRKTALFFAIGFFLSLPVFAVEIETAHYRLEFDSGAEASAESLGEELELRFNIYNKLFRFAPLFRFNPVPLDEKLRVKVFVNEDDYNLYISEKIGRTKGGALYLHYNKKESRELVVCRDGKEEIAMLPHQAFVQYLRGFIANPPSWMREGFAIYFSTLNFEPASKELSYVENLAWLTDVKKSKANAEPVNNIISSDIADTPYPEDFQIRSWALVSFLLNSGSEDCFRTLTECFLLLSPSASAAVNSIEIVKRLGEWQGMENMDKDYRAYLEARKTFTELVDEGREAYSGGDKINAEMSFIAAIDQKPEHYAPYYYLGLIYYEEKSYDLAAEFYESAIKNGADEALVSYALGLNAASAGNNAEALRRLRLAASLDETRYGEKTADLIKRLE